MKKLIIILLLLSVLLTSCKKDKTITPTPPVQDTSALVARDALYGLMQEWYLWYDHMPVITLDNYTNPYDLLEALRYKPIISCIVMIISFWPIMMPMWQQW